MSLLAQTSTQQIITSSLTATVAQFQTLSTLTFNVSSINGAVPGGNFSGSTVSLSSASITTSSLAAQFVTATQGYISSLIVDSLAIGSNSGFINMGDIITTSHSSLQINTGLFTASGAVCTPQLLVSSINGVDYSDTFRSTVRGLGAAGYVSTNQVTSTVVGLALAGYVSTTQLVSSLSGLGTLGYVSSTQLTSTATSLQNYISTLTVAAGNTTGTILYLNQSVNVNGYNALQQNVTLNPTSTLRTTVIDNTSNTPIAQFQTDFTLPPFIPAGFWDVNLFAYNTNTSLRLYATLYTRGAAETLIGTSIPVPITTAAVLPYTASIYTPYTSISTGSALVLKLFANNVGNQSQTLTTYYEGSNYSHVHTTFGIITSDTVTTSTVTGLGSAGYLSTLNKVPLISSLQMNTSSIVACNVSSATGYISSLLVTSLTVGGQAGYVTIQDLTTGTVSTGQVVAGAGFISSLQINSLSFGPSGYVIVGNFIASSLSTMKLNTQNLYTNNAYIGNASTQSAILFPGVDGNYRGTALAEQVTGPGTGELLLYKTSTTTDQIRLQTTGNIVFEAGASARSWPSTQTLATPTMYIAGSTSNVGIGTNAPGATLDVVGVVRAQTFSSLALNVSSINGAAPGGGGASFTGSTLSLSSGSVYASNIVVKYTGTVTSNTYGTGYDIVSLRTAVGGYLGAAASLYFGTSNDFYPLARIAALDQGSSYANSALLFQTATSNNLSLLTSVTYTYAGSNQTFIVPAGVTSLGVYMWGAGGGGGHTGVPGTVAAGGAGAFIQGTLSVTSGASLTIIVGAGGSYQVTTSNYGGGGAGGPTSGAQGGGRSAIQLSGTELVDVGGGGGAAYDYGGGYANYSPTLNGGAGYMGPGGYSGGGGTQTGGGAGGSGNLATGSPGTSLLGGAGGTYNGGGGGGFFGGGGGGTIGGNGGGGGGGSSYTTNPLFTLITGSNSPNSSNGAPATASPYYSSGAAVGSANTSVSGGNGLVVLVYNSPYALSETMRIANTGYVGIATSTPQALLHVSGMTYSIAVSTQALTVSSINGLPTTFTGSTTFLSSAAIAVSSLATNTAKTSSLTMYGTLNMSNNLLTNIYSALFAPSYSGNPNVAAGGLYTTYTSGIVTYAVHAFKTVGTTTFTPSVTITGAQILVIGGGGSGGGGASSGGGGAGGLVYVASATITPATYSIVVGGGGALASNPAYNTAGVGGSNSSALGYTGNGGGAGGSDQNYSGGSGGCGGGGCGLGGATGGTGTQGYAGGTAVSGDSGAGGGGMGSIGSANNAGYGGTGGSGVTYSITGTATGYAAGGGGSSATGTNPAVGGSANATIIGGNGGASTVPPTAGAANTGSGGGGQRSPSGFILPGAGGSGIVVIAYPLNQYSYTPYAVGTITGDATSNLSIQPVNNLNIVGTTQVTGLLAASSISTSYITVPSISTTTLQASTIGVGGGAWMSNDGLYLSNAQAGGAVGKLITNAGYVKLMTGTVWNGGYGALAITGGDLVPKVYMGMGTSLLGGNLAIGGLSPSPGGGITLDVFGAARFSSISTFQAVTSSIGVGMANPIFPLDVAGLGRFQILSTLALNVSSINGTPQWQQSYLTSTTEGLGTLGYISTTQLGSTVTNLITRIGAGGGGGTTFVGSTTFLSVAQVLFSTQTGYNISSVLGYVSSLQVDELQVGSGYGILSFGDTNMSSISTLAIVGGTGQFITLSSLTLNVSSINGLLPGTGSGTSFTGNLGTVSSLTALKYYGLTGLYQNSIVAEVSTGAGTQELLLYKVSSISDQVRVQTTGNVIFEAGVGARGWPTAPRLATPTFYIAGSNSNVGVGTSNPLTTLDVVGTGRFQTLSSLNITAGSINYSIAYV